MTKGILLALFAYASFAWGDGLIKSLGGQLTVFQIGFFIAFFAALFMLPARPPEERWRNFWRMKRPVAVQMRALSGVVAGMMGVFAFTTIPLAETYALIFLAPLFVTLLSVLVLKEKVGPWRWLAVAMGFAGVLLVVQPGFRVLELGHLAALGVSFLAALGIVLQRSLANAESRTTMLGMLIGYAMAGNAIGMVATSFALPGWQQAAVLAAVGLATATAQVAMLHATRLAPANLIAPTHYSQILWAVLIGALFFDEHPNGVALAGLAVVAASGLLTLMRERARLGTVRWNPLGRNRL